MSAAPNHMKMTEAANKHQKSKQEEREFEEGPQPVTIHGFGHLSKTAKPTESAIKRPQSAKHPAPKDIPFPECSFKSIMNYLIDKRLFRDLDLKVMYERLCYRYGE